MDLTPLLNKVARRIRSNLDLEAVADKSWEIAPAEQSHPPAAIFFEEDIAKIIAVAPFSKLQSQLRIIHAESTTHRSTKAYRICGAKLLEGTLFAERYQMRLTTRRSRLVRWGPIQDAPASILTSSRIGNTFFGDWLLHDLSMNLLAQELGQPVEINRKQWEHEPYYREQIGYEANVVDAARFTELTVIDDLGLNAHKRARYGRIRAALREGEAGHQGALCFLKRGKTGSVRTLDNEDDVESALQARGFVTLEPEQLSATALVSALLDASVVVGVEGSQLSHAAYCLASGGVLLALQPPERFNACYKSWLDAQDAYLRFAFMVGTPAGAQGEFRIDVNQLERLLDRL